MSGRVLARLAPVLLVVTATLSACGGDTDGDTDTVADPPATSQSPSADGESVAVGDTVAMAVTREDDGFTPNGERVELEVGQTLVLTIDADEAGELHVHGTPEQDIAYDAGTSEHEITIDRPGVVEVESHDPDLILLQLEVR